MRRVIVELSAKDVAKVLGESKMSEKVKSIETLAFLRSTPREVAAICRVEFEDPTTRFEDVFTDPSESVSLLETERPGTYTFFYKRKPLRRLLRIGSSVPGGYLSVPYETKEGRVRLTLLGSAKSVRGLLDSLTKARLKHRVISLGDPKFSPNSPLERLTEKQRGVLEAAFKLGYYDLPRKIGSKDLAKRFHIREPTVVNHRRKAERKILAEIFNLN